LQDAQVARRAIDGRRIRPDEVGHLARFDPGPGWIEMFLCSQRRQEVEVPGLSLSLTFEEGEKIRTEVSAKFTPQQVGAELGRAGLTLVDWWTDSVGDFGLSLSAVTGRG
jgi:L-histidine N-alpha-methyltransferase